MVRRLPAAALAIATAMAGCSGSGPRVAPPAVTSTAAARAATTAARPTTTRTAPSSSTAARPTTSTERPAPAHARSRAWVAAERGRVLVEVNLATLAVERRVTVPGAPHNLVVAPDGTVAATLPARGAVALVPPGAGAATIVTLGGSPHDVKVSGDTLVVTNEGAARIERLRLDGTRRGSIALPANPHDLGVVPGRAAAWVSLDGSNDLVAVDLVTAVVRRVEMPFRPHDVLVAPDGRLWVTKWGGGLARVSAAGALERDLPVGQEVHHLAIAPGGAQVWATDNAGRQVLVVDAAGATQVAALPLGGSPHHLAISGGRVAVADNTRGVVVVFDATTRARVGEVAVGPGPHGAWAAA